MEKKMYLKEAIEERINNLCKENNITINKLATICGITQSTLANWKVRSKTNISTLTILRICRGLNITIDQFFDDDLFRNNEFEDE
jgi:transcriptional regulator with XRE-family HTH domain